MDCLKDVEAFPAETFKSKYAMLYKHNNEKENKTRFDPRQMNIKAKIM